MPSSGEVRGEWEDFVRSRLGSRYRGDAWDVADGEGGTTWIFIAFRGRNRRDVVFRTEEKALPISEYAPARERAREIDQRADHALGTAKGNLIGWAKVRDMLRRKVGTEHGSMRE